MRGKLGYAVNLHAVNVSTKHFTCSYVRFVSLHIVQSYRLPGIGPKAPAAGEGPTRKPAHAGEAAQKKQRYWGISTWCCLFCLPGFRVQGFWVLS